MSTLLVDNIQPFSSGSTSVTIGGGILNATASFAVTASYALNGGGGGGTGLIIPKPIVYSTTTTSPGQHTYNAPLSSLGDGNGVPGSIIDSWYPEALKLTYQTGDLSFLAHNPKYFLFVYNSAAKYRKTCINYPNTRINNEKYGKYFAHPPNITGSLNTTAVSNAAYANFSGNTPITSGTNPNFSSFSTEWNVNTNTGQPTVLTGFNPLRFYWNINTASSVASEFFPWPVADSGSLSVTTARNFDRFAGANHSPTPLPPTPRVNLYVKFAIVVDDPSNVGRYIIGPMSDTIKVYPRAGYFDDDINMTGTQKYYYTWTTRYV